jgi:DNA ligase-1
VRFAEIAAASDRVASTSKKTEKIEILAACLRQIPKEEIDAAARYLAGQLRQKKLGIGWAGVSKSTAVGAEHASLSVADVDAVLSAIAQTSGSGSVKRRSDLLDSLIARASDGEQSFLRRLIIGELRQGALESLILDAIARAANLEVASVRRAQMVSADLGRVASAALFEGEAGLSRFQLELFQPVQPMLAQTAETVEEVLSRFAPAAFELKLDGARIQVHKSNDEVRVYTRRLNEATERIPELVDAVRALPARKLILDGESIALASDGAPHPFQVTMRRFGRRLEVEKMQKELPLESFFFDCLRIDDDTLIGKPASERIAIMSDALPEKLRVPRIVTADAAQADAFLQKVLDDGHEGVMAKSLDAPYEAGSRGASWLKLKSAHTLDLVVLAAEWGSGRRQGWLSNLHLGARDETTGGLIMLGKTFKGMTDEILEWQTKKLLELETRRERHIVWVRPELVVEVAFGDLQRSSIYPGGLALRFARIKRYRTDKTALEADTMTAVLRLAPKG